nr:DUF5597 domain-containing protein [Bacteroidota bacterium]
MKKRITSIIQDRLFIATIFSLLLPIQTLFPQSIFPHLMKNGSATQLIVHDKPFLMLAGELGNSSASNLNYMQPIWQTLKTMQLNTVLVPVYWELIEPQEGKFDFTLVDSIILSARKYDLKIVFLWFGSWKNSMSCYAPYWVKINQERFPRARTKNGNALEILTPFNEENRNSDGKAFASLMKHIRSIDSKENTVIMVQVENEIGMIPEARDYCSAAEKAFKEMVPKELIEYLQKHKNSLNKDFLAIWKNAGMKSAGTWEEVFGKGLQTDEIFMAWNFAKYTNYVAEEGKREYNIPMYVNAALIRPNYKPGQYPSAGPLPHLITVWRAAAPAIDFLAPDIYFKNFAEWLGKYDQNGNPIFIPEVDSRQSVTNAFYAIAHHNAMGYSPFAIESVENPESNQFNQAYNLLHQMMPLILANQGKKTIDGFLLDSAGQTARVAMGNFAFIIKHEYSWPYAARREGETPRYGGMIIQISDDEYYVAGSGVVITFESASKDGAIVGIASIDEGKFEEGKWIAGRRLNGDQSHQGKHLYLPGNEFGIQKVKLYEY